MLVQPVTEVNASAADHRKHRPRWRISALPVFYGIFPGTFLLTAWFSHMLGILLVDWNTTEVVVWPFVFGYRLFRKAPPWVLWKVPPLAIHLLKQYLETSPDALAFFERCILIEDWFLWIYHSKIVPWCQLNVQFASRIFMYTPFGLPYHDMRTNPLCNFEDKYQDKNNTTEPIQCYSIGSFPFTQLECFNAQSQSTSSHSESATTQARDVLTHSGLERYTYPLIFDTGASQCLTGVKSDFREFFPEGAQHSVIKGISQGLAIEGEGVVEYTLTCDDGSLVTIRAKSYFTGLGIKTAHQPPRDSIFRRDLIFRRLPLHSHQSHQ